ncbi:UNVERIFIED_CONTAM: DNA-binding XRE family transcriptional regulator [Acetivibrio alkalicellulosi]
MTTIIVNASKLAELRIKAGFTQNLLAKASGTNVSLISRLEKGDHTPRPDSALKICNALGVRFDDLFEISDESKDSVREGG